MFRNLLVRELAIILLIKLAFIWALWFAFFRMPDTTVSGVDMEALFGGPAVSHTQTRSRE